MGVDSSMCLSCPKEVRFQTLYSGSTPPKERAVCVWAAGNKALEICCMQFLACTDA